MASGHVNRTKRPNTWLHRPTLQNVKKALANPEPSTHGTSDVPRKLTMSGDRGESDVELGPSGPFGPNADPPTPSRMPS